MGKGCSRPIVVDSVILGSAAKKEGYFRPFSLGGFTMGFDFYIDGPIHHSDLLSPHAAKPESSLPMQFVRAAAYAGVQAPISGVVQMVDHVAGTKLLPKVQFIDPCDQAEFGTASWHVQQFGAMVGVTAGLLALNKGVGGA